MSVCQAQNHEVHVDPLNLATATNSPYPSIMAAVHRMTQDMDQERASRLAMEAVELANAGQVEVENFVLLGGA
jgi:hypothetical protein